MDCAMTEVYKSGPVELRCGRYQEALADVAAVDAVISDPPYGAKTHVGQRTDDTEDGSARRGIDYAPWKASDITNFVDTWAPRCRGWLCAFTSHDLIPAYLKALEGAGLYVFAPIACVQHGMNVRLAGDGPSNWTTYLIVARPRSLRAWGTLPGAYHGYPFDPGENTATASRRTGVVGSKPAWLMRAIVKDYTRHGDLIVDPCAGGATTLLAAAMEGRRAIGAEMDPETYRKAVRRLKAGYTPPLFNDAVPPARRADTVAGHTPPAGDGVGPSPQPMQQEEAVAGTQ